MAARINGFSLAYTAAGAVVLWSGIKGTTLSATFRGLLQGQAPGAGTEPITSTVTNATTPALQGPTPSGTQSPDLAEAAGTPGPNKALGILMAGAYGWGPGSNDWPYLESGWQEESGWNQYAANDKTDPYDHAYGIPQANPGTKMASAGADWKTSPATQIKWGLGYIKATYGSPSGVPGWTPDGPAEGYEGY